MFEEYLQCKGEWLNSTIVLNAKRSQLNQMIGENRYTTFKDLKAKLGVPAAKAIRASKKEQQKTHPSDLPPLWKKHPDLDIEDASFVLASSRMQELECFLVWDSTVVRRTDEDSLTHEVKAKVDLDGQQTRTVLRRGFLGIIISYPRSGMLPAGDAATHHNLEISMPGPRSCSTWHWG